MNQNAMTALRTLGSYFKKKSLRLDEAPSLKGPGDTQRDPSLVEQMAAPDFNTGLDKVDVFFRSGEKEEPGSMAPMEREAGFSYSGIGPSESQALGDVNADGNKQTSPEITTQEGQSHEHAAEGDDYRYVPPHKPEDRQFDKVPWGRKGGQPARSDGPGPQNAKAKAESDAYRKGSITKKR